MQITIIFKCTRIPFETEAQKNSEMADCVRSSHHLKVHQIIMLTYEVQNEVKQLRVAIE